MRFREDRNFVDPNYLDTIRAGNYKIEEAISELIDNSVDANATLIEVILVANRSIKTQIDTIIVADNGSGMNIYNLDHALVLGKKMKEDASLTGKYGQGLKASTLKYCDNGSIYTAQNQAYSKAVINFNDLKENNLQIGHPVSIERNDLRLITKFQAVDRRILNGDSFTVIMWENIIAENGSISKSIKTLNKDLGRKFRKYIDQGTVIRIKKIAMGDSENFDIEPNDPLKIDKGFEYYTPKVFNNLVCEFDGDFIIYNKVIDDKNISLKIRFSKIKEDVYRKNLNTNEKEFLKKIDDLKGISFVRGNREIELKPKFDDFFKPKNEGAHKYIGCEIIYSSENDIFFDTDAKKNSVNIPNTSLLYDFFDNYIGKSFYEIQTINSKIASDVKKQSKMKIYEKSKAKINFIEDERKDYFIEAQEDTCIVNLNSSIYKKNSKSLIESIIKHAQDTNDITFLKLLEEITFND